MEKRNEQFTWYPWHPQDWRANRKVARMTPAERGIYRELLDECWLEGSIPGDMDDLAEIARCTPAEMAAAWPALRSSFSERPDGRFVNDKIARVHLAQLEALARQRDGGRKGGQQRVANLKAALSHPQAKKREIDISLPARVRLVGAPPTGTNGKLRDLQGTPVPDVMAEAAEPMSDEEKAGWRTALGSRK